MIDDQQHSAAAICACSGRAPGGAGQRQATPGYRFRQSPDPRSWTETGTETDWAGLEKCHVLSQMAVLHLRESYVIMINGQLRRSGRDYLTINDERVMSGTADKVQ